MSNSDLERRLFELGENVVFPPTPDLARPVSRRIRHGAGRRWRWALGLTAGLLLALTVFLGASQPTRDAIAGFLGLPGFEVRKVERLPTTSPPTTRQSVSLAEAKRQVTFHVLVPANGAEVKAVWYDPQVPGGMVELDLNEGVVITEFQGAVEPATFGKMVGPETTVTPVTVNGQPGYWFAGAPHLFFYRDRDGVFRQLDLRLSGNTLVWQQDGQLLRVEGASTKAQALAVAAALR